MAPKSQSGTADILSVIEKNPQGLSISQIADSLPISINYKALQRRLAALAVDRLIHRVGEKKGRKYVPASQSTTGDNGHVMDKDRQVFGSQSRQILKFLDTPPYGRTQVSYRRDFLDRYIPNETAYVPAPIKRQLTQVGKRFDRTLAAGTYAREICQRLLIDLSYNSSRLEGNTYSMLDTQRLIEQGIEADGKIHEESVMIMNHKEAILFLIENARDMELNSLAVRNLHHLLAQDLLANPLACGQVRSIGVSIGQSAYTPLDNPHLLAELLELVLLKGRQINDPFEQSFFLLVHLSYLQAFEDVNKRTSRLGCNIPLITQNFCPLSFIGVSREEYTAALLAIYEINQVQPMLIFMFGPIAVRASNMVLSKTRWAKSIRFASSTGGKEKQRWVVS